MHYGIAFPTRDTSQNGGIVKGSLIMLSSFWNSWVGAYDFLKCCLQRQLNRGWGEKGREYEREIVHGKVAQLELNFRGIKRVLSKRNEG